MDGQKRDWQQNITGLWNGLKAPQRVALVAGAVVLLAVALYAGFWSQTPDYATLFSGLDQADAAAVVEQLKELKVPYRLANGGATIQVPERQVYDVRLEMAKQGLPKGGTVGFELFDGGQLGSLGMTDFMQRVNYQRALEGELGRTISSLEPVAAARVHIVVPEPALFTSQQREPTASIVLQLKPRAELSREHVRAITHLVASSIEGLKASNITLVDMQGTVLSAAGEGDTVPAALQASTGQLEMQHSYERELETRLQTMLDQALGANRAVVRASASFNWDQKETNSETWAPRGDGTGVVRSEETSEETYEGTNSGAGGIPGVESNVQAPTYPSAEATSPGTFTKRSTARNYEVSKVVQSVTQAPGILQRLSVAVLVDEKIPADKVDGLRAMMAAAAGLDTSRGDAITVQAMPFEAQVADEGATAVAEAERNATILNYGKLGGLFLLLLLLLRFAYVTFRELSRRLSGEYVPYMTIIEPELAETSASSALLDRLASSGAAQASAGALPASLLADREPSAMVPESTVSILRKQLTTVAERDPELIAELVQTWLAEPS